jgi:hypothetical protein
MKKKILIYFDHKGPYFDPYLKKRVKDYNTKSHFYKTIQKHVHTIAIITQNFFEH